DSIRPDQVDCHLGTVFGPYRQLGNSNDGELTQLTDSKQSPQQALDSIQALHRLYSHKTHWPWALWIGLEHPDLEFLHLDGKPLSEFKPEDLVNRCKPSGYGDLKTGMTQYDISVRLASECSDLERLRLTPAAQQLLDNVASIVSTTL